MNGDSEVGASSVETCPFEESSHGPEPNISAKSFAVIGSTVFHYKILEKVGEVPNFPAPACVPKDTSAGRSVSQRAVGSVRIPACLDELPEAGKPRFM
jgi:hypothetical protein